MGAGTDVRPRWLKDALWWGLGRGAASQQGPETGSALPSPQDALRGFWSLHRCGFAKEKSARRESSAQGLASVSLLLSYNFKLKRKMGNDLN